MFNLIINPSHSGLVTTLAGCEGGFAEGRGYTAKFSSPCSIALDANKNLYVCDTQNQRIRRISPDGTKNHVLIL